VNRNIKSIYYKNKSYNTFGLINNTVKIQDIKIQEVVGTIIDLYVKFTDIYQQLDDSYIYSQIAHVSIEQAGNFGSYSPAQQLPKDIHFPYDNGWNKTIQTTINYINAYNKDHLQTPDYDATNNHEFYQHIRF
jgi:hypothetical protein